MSGGWGRRLEENGFVELQELSLPVGVFQMIVHMHVTLDGDGEEPIEDDVFQVTDLNNLIALLQDLHHRFHSGYVCEDGLSAELPTLGESILVLGERVPIFGKEMSLQVVPDSVDIIFVVLSEYQSRRIVIVNGMEYASVGVVKDLNEGICNEVGSDNFGWWCLQIGR